VGYDLDGGIARTTQKGHVTFCDKAFTVDKKDSVCAAKAVGLGVWTRIEVTYEDHDAVRVTLAAPYVDKLLVMLFRFPERWQSEYQCDPVLALACA
jgi:hypothetical protein